MSKRTPNKRIIIFPLFEEMYRTTAHLTDAQLGKAIRCAMSRYFDGKEDAAPNALTRFASEIMLEQAARYDSFREQQRSKALSGRNTEEEQDAAQEQPGEVCDPPKQQKTDSETDEPAEPGQTQPNTPPDPSPDPDPNPKNNSLCAEAVTLLNRLSGSSFSPKTKATRRLVSAREREGYGLEEFKTVIRHQCGLWGRDEKMRKYLRPETLFGTKFEAYLSDARRIEPPQEETGYVLAPLEDPWEVAMRGAHYD